MSGVVSELVRRTSVPTPLNKVAQYQQQSLNNDTMTLLKVFNFMTKEKGM